MSNMRFKHFVTFTLFSTIIVTFTASASEYDDFFNKLTSLKKNDPELIRRIRHETIDKKNFERRNKDVDESKLRKSADVKIPFKLPDNYNSSDVDEDDEKPIKPTATITSVKQEPPKKTQPTKSVSTSAPVNVNHDTPDELNFSGSYDDDEAPKK